MTLYYINYRDLIKRLKTPLPYGDKMNLENVELIADAKKKIKLAKKKIDFERKLKKREQLKEEFGIESNSTNTRCYL
jgi:hypothetical protein